MIEYASDKIAVRHHTYRFLVNSIRILEACDGLDDQTQQRLENFRIAAARYELSHKQQPDEFPIGPIEEESSAILRGSEKGSMPAALTIGFQGSRALRKAGVMVAPAADLSELVVDREHLTHAVLVEPAIGEKGLWAVSFYDSLIAASVDYKRARAARQVVLQETTGKVIERRKLE